MYSSGFRTEQGLVSILSGFPAQPNNSIITSPGKAEQLPSLNIELGKKGYQSSFYYGGEVEFANMKSYLLNTHFEKIVDKNNFDKLSKKIIDSGTYVFKDNTSPGESLYFLDPDGHKLEIHSNSWQDRVEAKKLNLGKWKNVEWFA